MVDLKTAVEEINTGKIEFTSQEDVCTTEGEVVTHLKRLLELDTPQTPYNKDKRLRYFTCPYCGSDRYLFNRNGERNPRCGYCGKKLDWDK